MDVDERIGLASGRLRLGKVGLNVEWRGGMLWLRGTLPPKPSSSRVKAYRQRFALGVKANPAGGQHAERQARLMDAQLNLRQFVWADWLAEVVSGSGSVADWVERYTKEFRHSVADETWLSDYQNVLAKLPGNGVLTADLLKDVVLDVQERNPNSRNQRRYALFGVGVLSGVGGGVWFAIAVVA